MFIKIQDSFRNIPESMKMHNFNQYDKIVSTNRVWYPIDGLDPRLTTGKEFLA